MVCSSHLGGSLSSTGAKGFVLIGGDGDDNCGPNAIAGSLVLRNNTGGLEAIANTVGASVVTEGNSGAGPPPEDASPEDASPEDASPEVSGNGRH